MSDLTYMEKNKLEKLFKMEEGYILDFSNKTLQKFVVESTGIDIYSDKYACNGTSKANRIRVFWNQESNHLVGKLLSDMLEYCRPSSSSLHSDGLFEACHRIVARLLQNAHVEEIDAIKPEGDDHDFEMLARAVRHSIEKNEPETGLDRLHTFVIKLVRTLSKKHGIATDRNKPLHSIFGEYVKKLREEGLIKSEMTERILKSSIKTMEAFNQVRNDMSLAHDNPMLNYDESLLIFNHVCSSVRFIRALESHMGKLCLEDP